MPLTRTFFLFLWICSAPLLQAQTLQNMVKNPSLEQYQKVPTDLGQVNALAYWSSANGATPDYFHARVRNVAIDVPKNRMGIAEPRTGKGYAGIYAYTSRYAKQNFREYLQVQLKQPMEQGATYCIKVHVFLAHSSNRALRALGVIGSRFVLENKHEHFIETDWSPLIKPDRSYIDERSWVELRGNYEAVGGERYLSIGNFAEDKKTDVVGAVAVDSFSNPNVDFAYYYVDDVCVTDLSSNFACNCGSFDYYESRKEEVIVLDIRIERKPFNMGERKVLENVKFEKNTAILLPKAHRALDDLAARLKLFPDVEIAILGHTHDRRQPEKNQEISNKRAMAVFHYLVSSGVDPARLTVRGFGQARPRVLNTSPEGREANERIEYKVLRM